MRRGFLEEVDSVEGAEDKGPGGARVGGASTWTRGWVSQGLWSRGWGLWPSPRLQAGAPPRARTVVFVVRVMASAGVLRVLLTSPLLSSILGV